MGTIQPANVVLEDGQVAQQTAGVLVANAATAVVTTVANGITQPDGAPATQLIITGSNLGPTNQIIGPDGQLIQVPTAGVESTVQLVTANEPQLDVNPNGELVNSGGPITTDQSAMATQAAGGGVFTATAVNQNVAMGTMNLPTGNMNAQTIVMDQSNPQTFAVAQNAANLASNAKTKSKKKNKNSAKHSPAKSVAQTAVKDEESKPVLNSTIAKILESAKREMEMKANGGQVDEVGFKLNFVNCLVDIYLQFYQSDSCYW